MSSQSLTGPDGKFRLGNPGGPGRPPETVSAAMRRLMREVAVVDGENVWTRADRLAAVAYERAMSDRRDAVLWAKLILERCDGPPRADVADSLGFGAIAAREFDRWVKKEERGMMKAEDAEFSVKP